MSPPLGGCLAVALSLVASCNSRAPDTSPPIEPPRIAEPVQVPEPEVVEVVPEIATLDPEPSDAHLQLALGGAHTCVLRGRGDVVCFGSHRFGQLGTTVLPAGFASHRPTASAVVGLENAVRLVAGTWHNCALLRGGSVSCWGHGGFGQLGQPDSLDRDGSEDRRTPHRVDELAQIVELAAGEGHTCARRSDRVLFCWGSNQYGQLGLAGVSDSPTPRRLALEDVRAVAAGRYHTCAILGDEGQLVCWGSNLEGQLGLSERTIQQDPTTVRDGVEAVHAGGEQTCVVDRSSVLRCYGGGGGARRRARTTEVFLGSRNGCVRSGGRLRCFGQGGAGPAARIDGLVALGIGARHFCAGNQAGEVACWGHNDDGQLGDGTTDRRPRPTPVTLP